MCLLCLIAMVEVTEDTADESILMRRGGAMNLNQAYNVIMASSPSSSDQIVGALDVIVEEGVGEFTNAWQLLYATDNDRLDKVVDVEYAGSRRIRVYDFETSDGGVVQIKTVRYSEHEVEKAYIGDVGDVTDEINAEVEEVVENGLNVAV